MATLGVTAAGTVDGGSISSGDVLYYYVGQMSEAGTLTAAVFDLDASELDPPTTTSLTATVAVMKAAGAPMSTPSTVLDSAQRTDLTSRSQHTFSMVATAALASGDHIWLAITRLPASFTSIHPYQTGTAGNNSFYETGTTYPAIPTSPSNQSASNVIAAYIIYTAAGATTKYLRNKALTLGVGA